MKSFFQVGGEGIYMQSYHRRNVPRWLGLIYEGKGVSLCTSKRNLQLSSSVMCFSIHPKIHCAKAAKPQFTYFYQK